MTNIIDHNALDRWRADPASFVEECLIDPETGQAFVLLEAEKAFLLAAFTLDDNGRLLYSELIYACPKKSGKTTWAAIFVIVLVMLFGGSYAEAIICANDFEQSVGRVHAAIRRIVECSPMLRAIAKMTADKVMLADATIRAIPSDFASAAGSNQNIAVFDELWAFGTERARRLFDELVPVPTRKIACRLTVTYAGFENESTLLLELYKRGLQQPQIGTDLYAGDGILMFWSHQPIAPWQTESWIAEMRRSLRPSQFLRMIECRFTTNESSFIDMALWDRCVNPSLGTAITNPALPIWIGVDASTKHDSTAVVAVTFDQSAQMVRLVFHRIFQPSPEEPLNFEATVEATLLELQQRFQIRKVLFDPYQMMASAQRLAQAGLRIEEYPQSPANLTIASQNLFDLVNAQALICYPDAAMRLAMSRAVAVETVRGWRIAKEKQSHKIDVIVALAMACHAAIASQHEPVPALPFGDWVSGPDAADPKEEAARWQATRFFNYVTALSSPALYNRPRMLTWR